VLLAIKSSAENEVYRQGGKDLAAVYKKSSVGSTQSSEIGYVVKDHFVNETRLLQACAAKAVGRINPYGSSVWALANETGGFVDKYAYDPCSRVLQTRQRSAAGLAGNRNPDEPQRNREGRRMLPDSWNKRDSLRTTFFTDRGFTLHEHYDKLQIININARMYACPDEFSEIGNPILGEFTSVDPLADKYPGWGPYVYCVNNPLVYMDLSGKYLVGKDGNPVEFKNGTWSENVTPEIERMGNAMLKTKVGSKALGNMMDGKHPITVQFDTKYVGNVLAKTETDKHTSYDKNGKVSSVIIKSQTVTININAIQDVLDGKTKSPSSEGKKLLNAYTSSCSNVDQAIGAAATHEGFHTTEEGQLLKEKYKNGETKTNEAEERARELEYKALEETLENTLTQAIDEIDKIN